MARRDFPNRSGPGRSEPDRSPPRRRRDPEERSFIGRWLRRLFVWGTGFVLLGALALVVAVFITERSLPSYDRLKSTQTGQTIVVRANDGSEIVTLGPSYGRWVPYERIPKTLKDAMISVEDRRFRDHWGVDPIGIARSLWVRVQSGHFRPPGRVDHHAAARAQHFPQQQPHFGPQDPRGAAGAGDRAGSSPRIRCSSSISTRSISAAGLTASILPRASSSAIRASS